MRYVKDAPLKALTADYKRAIKGKLATQSASSSTSPEVPREKLKDDVLKKVNNILADAKQIEFRNKMKETNVTCLWQRALAWP